MKRIFACGALCALCLSAAFAEQYRIAEVHYDIQGRTKEGALERTVDVDTETLFPSRADFDAYLAFLSQVLTDIRTLERFTLTERLGEADECGVIPVELEITAADTYNYITVPYLKYNSNSGFELKLKTKDFNFLGLLQEMNFDVVYQNKKDVGAKTDDGLLSGSSKIGLAFNYNLPFLLSGFEAQWLNSFALSYTFGEGKPKFDLTSGLMLTFPLMRDRLSAQLIVKQSVTQDFDYEYDVATDEKIPYGDELHYTEYASFAVPVEIARLKRQTAVVFAPEAHFSYAWNPRGVSHPDLLGPVVGPGYALSARQVNWERNYRTGYSVRLAERLDYNAQKGGVYHALSGEAARYAAFGRLAFAARGYAFVGVPLRGDKWSSASVGGLLRGVRDAQKGAEDVEAALVLNADLPVKLFQTDWRSLRLPGFSRAFDFELQASPFFDAAFVYDKELSVRFSPKNGWYAGGLELLVFPSKWRSVTGRASFGVDLGRFFVSREWRDDASPYELSIGVGMHY